MKKILFLFLSITISSLAQIKDAKFYYDYAVDSIFENDTRLSIEYFTKAIELDSSESKFYFQRSKAWNELKYRINSLNDINRAIELEPDKAVYYLWKMLYLYESDYTTELVYQNITDLDSLVPARYRLALETISKGMKLNSTADVYKWGEAVLLEKLGQYEDALEVYKYLNNNYSDNGLDLNFGDFEQKILELNSFLNDKNNIKYERQVGYYPYQGLTIKDSLEYPIKIDVEFNLKDIKFLDEDENFVDVDFQLAFYSSFPANYIKNSLVDISQKVSGDTLTVGDLSERVVINSLDDSKKIYEGNYIDNINRFMFYSDSGTSKVYHNWEMRDFPFDTQILEIPIDFYLDSSIVELRDFFLYDKNNFAPSLQEGITISDTKFVKQYNPSESSDIDVFSPTEYRNSVYPVVKYQIELTRSGSLLFIKLFLGTFLAFVMSLSAFTIKKRNFGSRIDVSVGALFIAVGNKYFVESVTPMVQVLTKADIINNLSLLLIIMNVVFIVAQHRSDINIGKFEDSHFTLKFSSILLAILVFLTIIS